MKDHDLSDLRLLLVDDSRTFLSLLTDVLHGFGIRDIIRTSEAVEAFEIIEREELDVALVDYRMPLIDGLEFANMVRTAPDSRNKFLSMVLVTGHCSRKVVMDSIKAGFDDFLAKPMRPAHLHQKLVQLKYNPKHYVLTPTGYFGPDRRRRPDPSYAQNERRSHDKSIVVTPEDLRTIEIVQSMASMGNDHGLQRVWQDSFKDQSTPCSAADVEKAAAAARAPNPIMNAVSFVSAGA